MKKQGKKKADGLSGSRRSILNEQLSENEAKTNFIIVMVSFGFIAILLALLIFNKLTYSYTVDIIERYVYAPACGIMIIIDFLAFAFKFNRKWIKYALMAGIMLVCSVGAFVFTTYVFYLVLIPIVLSTGYFNKKFTLIVACVTEGLFIVICFLNFSMEPASGTIRFLHERAVYYPWKSIFDVMGYIFVPISIVIIFFSVYIISVTTKGADLIRTQSEGMAKVSYMDAELETAAEIQRNALPNAKYTTPNGNFSILAVEKTAREVGGDFYDYFMLNENTLAVLIADVSDKGLSAAMFMMSAKKALRCAAECCHCFDEAVILANKLICEDNKSEMFITLWFALLDTRTGVGKFINAGHLPPMIKSKDGSVRFIENDPDLFLGLFPEYNPAINYFRLKEGDVLILYTDGVTDALNPKGESFGIDRLVDTVSQSLPDARTIVQEIHDKGRAFAQGVEQYDDMTISTIFCHDIEQPVCVTVEQSTTSEGIKACIDTVENILKEEKCPDDVRRNMELIVDEICVNITDYAYEDSDLSPDECTIKLKIISGSNFIRMTFSDRGIPFNPLENEDPVACDIPEIGGWGIFLTKNLSDAQFYEYKEDQNMLTIGKIWGM